jgi:hypothetical protein
MTSRFGLPTPEILIEPFQTHVFETEIAEVVEKNWRPRRDSNPCYRRERRDANRSINKLESSEVHRNTSQQH